MNNKQLFILPVLLTLAVSCFNNEPKQFLASVNDKDLFMSDVIKEMPKETEDSVFFVERYMHDWIRKQLMIYNAKINLESDLLDHERKIKEYRHSLLIYAYQQELINQNFDTAISNQDIFNYYAQYHEEFKLTQNIFKGRYIVVEKSAPKLQHLSKWYKLESVFEELTDYCQQFSKEYYLEDSSWQYFSTINAKLPDLINDERYFLENTKSTWFEDAEYRYYIYIKDYQIKGSISPLALERNKIRNVLLNKNKIEYLKEFEDKLYQNSLALGKIKIYTNE